MLTYVEVDQEEGLPIEMLEGLLGRSHSLNGAVLIGLDGLVIEIQARAMNAVPRGQSWRSANKDKWNA